LNQNFRVLIFVLKKTLPTKKWEALNSWFSLLSFFKIKIWTDWVSKSYALPRILFLVTLKHVRRIFPGQQDGIILIIYPWRRKGGDAAPIRPCRNFRSDDDIFLGQNVRSFFCRQMRKSNEICENLGFILVATVTDFLSARLRQPVTIATSESPYFHRFRYSPSSGGRKRNESFPWGRYHHRLKNLPD
jgi:hypothetical protein